MYFVVFVVFLSYARRRLSVYVCACECADDSIGEFNVCVYVFFFLCAQTSEQTNGILYDATVVMVTQLQNENSDGRFYFRMLHY